MTTTLLAKRIETQSVSDLVNNTRCEVYTAQSLIKVIAQTLANGDDFMTYDLCINNTENIDPKSEDLISVLDLAFGKLKKAISNLDTIDSLNTEKAE